MRGKCGGPSLKRLAVAVVCGGSGNLVSAGARAGREKRPADGSRSGLFQGGKTAFRGAEPRSGGVADVPRGAGASALLNMTDHAREREVDDKVDERRKAEDDGHLRDAHGLSGVAGQQGEGVARTEHEFGHGHHGEEGGILDHGDDLPD